MVYVNIHTISSNAATLSNRDDSGQQKSCMYGGVLRARESSQSNTRAARDLMRRRGVAAGVSTSTVDYVGALARKFVCEADLSEEEAAALSESLFELLAKGSKAQAQAQAQAARLREELDDLIDDTASGVVVDEGNQKLDYSGVADLDKGLRKKLDQACRHWATAEKGALRGGALMRLSPGQYQGLYEIGLRVHSGEFSLGDKKEKAAVASLLESALIGRMSLDMAAFGRMFAANPEMKVEAAAQVAHSIGINQMSPDWDFFTAMDDERDQAALVDVANLSSPLWYKHRSVHVPTLRRNLSAGLPAEIDAETLTDALSDLVSVLIEAAPKGASTSHGPQSLPSTVYLTVSSVPTTLSQAFLDTTESAVEAEERLLATGRRLAAGYGGVVGTYLWSAVSETDQTSSSVAEIVSEAVAAAVTP